LIVKVFRSNSVVLAGDSLDDIRETADYICKTLGLTVIVLNLKAALYAQISIVLFPSGEAYLDS
jgi:hypothetical protein